MRRRLDHLRKHGLLARQSSPNGKRYQVRDHVSDICLTYGIDLSPLFEIHDHLKALAEQCLQDALRSKVLRSVIRDILFHWRSRLSADLAETATRSLRRTLPCEDLQEIVDTLRRETSDSSPGETLETDILTATDGQNDRHIQMSNEEDFDSEAEQRNCETLETTGPIPASKPMAGDDITVQECICLAPNAAELACEPTEDWHGVIKLSTQLAPAIGLQAGDVETARSSLGVLGCALAVIGLVESFGRIRNPRAYLHALARRAKVEGLDPVRMFRSLTAKRPLGRVAMCR